MNLDDVKSIVDLMDEKGLVEFELEEKGVRIAIKKSVPSAMCQPPVPIQPVAAAQYDGIPSANPSPSPPDNNFEEIKAPFVGTFYRASSPDIEPYVNVGTQVEPDKVLCVIEAMKVMNEIKADMTGIVREILSENACPVEYGQPLFRIEKM